MNCWCFLAPAEMRTFSGPRASWRVVSRRCERADEGAQKAPRVRQKGMTSTGGPCHVRQT